MAGGGLDIWLRGRGGGMAVSSGRPEAWTVRTVKYMCVNRCTNGVQVNTLLFDSYVVPNEKLNGTRLY